MEKLFYKSILNHTEYEIPKIKWSRFIWNVFHIKNKEEAENYIKEISNKYGDATHNCFAYTYGANINFDLFWNLDITADNFRQSDDWEPTNTAWKPILAQIQGQNFDSCHKIFLMNIIVSRLTNSSLFWMCKTNYITFKNRGSRTYSRKDNFIWLWKYELGHESTKQI